MNESNNPTVSFDRMRNMLVRAAEIRESEQQQIFDALDEIHARLAPLESIGSVRKRLSEMPDRTEVSVLAERLDDALAKLEAQDSALATMGRAVEAIVDRLATPFAKLDGRLDGVAGRFEGVAGKMDGLEDKLANIHRRLDELDGHLNKQDARLESVPAAVHGPVRERVDALESALRGRMDEVDEGVHEHLDGAKDALHGALTNTHDTVHGKLDENRAALHAALEETRDTVDATERLESLARRLEEVTGRLDSLTSRLDTVEDGFTSALGDLGGTIAQSLSQVEGTVSARPDAESVESMVRKHNDESVRQIGGHLEEAMATFAELMLGGSAPAAPTPPTTLPRQAARRRNTKSKVANRVSNDDDSTEDADLAAG